MNRSKTTDLWRGTCVALNGEGIRTLIQESTMPSGAACVSIVQTDTDGTEHYVILDDEALRELANHWSSLQ